MNLEHVLCSGGRGDDEDIGFFADPNLVADTVDRGLFEVGVQGQVVETTVGEAVAVVWLCQRYQQL